MTDIRTSWNGNGKPKLKYSNLSFWSEQHWLLGNYKSGTPEFLLPMTHTSAHHQYVCSANPRLMFYLITARIYYGDQYITKYLERKKISSTNIFWNLKGVNLNKCGILTFAWYVLGHSLNLCLKKPDSMRKESVQSDHPAWRNRRKGT